MLSDEIRDRFLSFFRDKNHKIVESDLLVPRDDPTLLFTGAGMNQFKDQFMGKNIVYTRAASCQKCIRTGDLENVGKTPRHHTFFEMLGNFSFGDYFKRDAIRWAWDFMTKEMNIPEERLWVSVYRDDNESYDIWINEVGVPAGRVVKMGAKDNFWPSDAPTKGPNGPCGPCSEIFYDWGPDQVRCGDPSCDPSCDCGRFVEVWNLVFTEFERKPDGGLVPLPNKNIDTGMGLERITAVMQGSYSNFGTDVFAPMIKTIKAIVGEGISREDIFLIADHVRSAVLAICDGVSPSNEKRGYVVRKLIRRAFLKSSSKEPVLYRIVPDVVEKMRKVYPELGEKREHIAAIILEEEKRFNDTLCSAMPVLDEMMEKGGKSLSGEDVFKLVDTYGLPLEIIQDKMLAVGGKDTDIDIKGFERLMDQRKEQSRKGSDISCDFIFRPDLFAKAPRPKFSAGMPLEATIEYILVSGEEVDTITPGECAEIITCPQSADLYSESGGQIGDKGFVSREGAQLEIVNVFESDGRKILQVVARQGRVEKGEKVVVEIDRERKGRTACNHTATHLLQAALRVVLGDTVKQAGSHVDDKRLRFDFTHMKKVSDRELIKVQDMVNGWISEDISVCKGEKTLEEARKEGALSFFGEKYGEVVRVVSVGDKSKELCGGTHVDNTGIIELVKITAESSVASGIRRIEAVTGEEARVWVKRYLNDFMKEKLGGRPPVTGGDDTWKKIVEVAEGKKEVDSAVVHEFDEIWKDALSSEEEKRAKEEKNKAKKAGAELLNAALRTADSLAADPVKIKDVNLVAGIIEGVDMNILRQVTGAVEKKVRSSVVLLGSRQDDKAYLMCAVTVDIGEKDIDAKELITFVSTAINGSGGGKKAFAQAGGKDPSGLEKALAMAVEYIEKRG
ncbi:MAG: alanine--tRNA ligase [Candidatus Omnitrophica bacterium]|nr:alanine--tRNA ligase [Candidatus Omnitrophota bacterium]MDD5487476.1 alanine--tRNA ligase [Candidatus Omnitrophota bacterium]